MRSTTRKRTGRRLALGSGLLALIVGILPTISAPAVAQIASGSSGVVCTTSPTATFSLTAQSGYIGMPDGNVILAWSYGVTGGAFQFLFALVPHDLMNDQGPHGRPGGGLTLLFPIQMRGGFPGRDHVRSCHRAGAKRAGQGTVGVTHITLQKLL